MHSYGLSIELNGEINFVRFHPGDWSIRIGAWEVTLLWGGRPFGDGLYVEKVIDPVYCRQWTWADMRAFLAFWRRSKAA